MGIENWDELLDYCSEEFRKEVVLTRYYASMWKRNQERPGFAGAHAPDKEFSEAIMHQRERLRHISEDRSTSIINTRSSAETTTLIAQPETTTQFENTNEIDAVAQPAAENTNEIAQPAAEGRNSGGGEN
jgi:hypothetical protein